MRAPCFIWTHHGDNLAAAGTNKTQSGGARLRAAAPGGPSRSGPRLVGGGHLWRRRAECAGAAHGPAHCVGPAPRAPFHYLASQPASQLLVTSSSGAHFKRRPRTVSRPLDRRPNYERRTKAKGARPVRGRRRGERRRLVSSQSSSQRASANESDNGSETRLSKAPRLDRKSIQLVGAHRGRRQRPYCARLGPRQSESGECGRQSGGVATKTKSSKRHSDRAPLF